MAVLVANDPANAQIAKL